MYEDSLRLIKDSQKITLVSHIAPDGDALGSSLAFYLVLKKMGKNVKIFNATKILAKRYDFLPSFSKIKNTFPQNCDLVISFDCGSFDRLGIEKERYKLINIDHHKSNTKYGDINIIDASHASTSAVVYDILQALDIMIDKDIATCIYTALAEDTNFFTTNNVDEKVFRLAAELTLSGANPAFVAQNIRQRNSLAKVRLTALFIDTLNLYQDGSVAVGEVTEEMFKKSGALRYDTTEFVDILLDLATVQLAIFVLSMPDGDYKLSLRSKERDVSKIAHKLGGGGHHHAAGLSVKKEDKDIMIKQIIDEVMG
jgi:phosphoesterase RecJ-like protein